MESWVGSYEYQLVEAWGVPDKSYTASNGKRYIEYIVKDSYIQDDKEVSYQCRRTFIVEQGVIMGGSYDC